MISDVVCECLVKKEVDVVQMVKIAAVFLGGFLISFELMVLVSIHDPIRMLGPALLLVGLFLTVFFGRRLIFVEYEYAYFGGEISFDKISAKSKRKHLTDVELKSVEKIGRIGDESLQKLSVTKICDYSASKNNENTIYLYFKDEKTGNNTVILFTPNQKMLDAMKTAVNAAVYREFFSTARKN